MKKTIIILAAGLVILSAGAFYFFNDQKPDQTQEQAVLEQTLNISREYASLRYKTDNVLIGAKSFGNYDSWKKEMSDIIEKWKTLENSALTLESLAKTISEEKVSLNIVKTAQAYTKEEISNIVDKAPMGKKIMTLAKHLGVDAKMAQLVLNQSQDEMSREAYGEEGDVFETCEQNSMRIKNSAKVTVFVGTIVATGGTSALAASGALAQTAVVVSGADLALEVTEDEARIALGDKNKVTEYVSDIRSVTEPAASILTLASIPGNLSKAADKMSAFNFGLDQIKSVAVDEKILGISIKTDEKNETKAEVSGLTETELAEWKKDNNATASPQPIEEIIKQIDEENKEETQADTPKAETKKETPKTSTENIPNQNIKVTNVSGSSWMIDTSFNPKGWDDLAAKPEEDISLGGIYTLGKVFGNGEGFSKQFKVAPFRDSGRLVETSANSYKLTLYFALAPFEGSENKTIDYGTWLSESVEINANYGDEPIIEWDGSSLKQVK